MPRPSTRALLLRKKVDVMKVGTKVKLIKVLNMPSDTEETQDYLHQILNESPYGIVTEVEDSKMGNRYEVLFDNGEAQDGFFRCELEESKKPLTRDQIRTLVDLGVKVYWQNLAYVVVSRKTFGDAWDLYIKCTENKSMTYLEKGQEKNCFIEEAD